jgi:WD40 repeat protein
MTFDGFISYSHAADGRLAPAVQRGLHRLAKPWHRRRALWIFRDQTGLAVTPTLWTSIQQALDGSDHFVLLASPEAARSPWVNREIEHWVATKPADRILPVVTDGDWQWDPARGDFTDESTAVPAALRGVFAEEPLYLDLRWARDDLHLSLQHARFRDAIAQLAAPMHGISKDELEGEDVRQHRRARRLWSVAAGALMLLAFVAVLTGALAVRNADRANAAALEVQRQAQLVVEQQGSAQRSAQEARRQEGLARQQQARAKEAATEVRRQEDLARQQKTLAARASTEAGRQQANARYQRALADGAAARAREQEALAHQQRTAAQRSAEEARQQRTIAQEQQARAQEQEGRAQRSEERARDQEERARKAAQEARRLEQIARDQEKEAREAAEETRRQQQIAVSQRLLTQARRTIDDDPKTALMLGLAAERVQPDAGTRAELSGLLASTHFAGTLEAAIDSAYGPDNLLAVVTPTATVSLWDVTNRTRPVRLSTIDRYADTSGAYIGSKVSLSPDGRTLGFVTPAGTAVLWDVTNRARPVEIGALPDAKVDEVVFNPDGRTFASTGPTASLWTMADGAGPRRLVRLPEDQLFSDLAFSPDGRTMVATFNRHVWDVSIPAQPVKVGSFPVSFSQVAFSPDQPVLAAHAVTGEVYIWNMEKPTRPWKYTPLSGYNDRMTLELALDPSGTMLAVADSNEKLTLWNVGGAHDPVRIFSTAARERLKSVEFSRDGRTLVSGDGGGTTLYNVAAPGAPEPVTLLTGHEGAVETMGYRPDGRSMITVDEDGTAIIWDTTPAHQGTRRATVRLPGQTRVTEAAIAPDGHTVAAADASGRVTLYDVSDPARPVTLRAFDERLTDFATMAFSPDGRTLAIRGHRTLRLWDVSGRARPIRLGTLNGDNLVGDDVAFSPDGHTVALTTRKTVTLVDVTDPTDPTPLTELPGDASWVQALAFSPDGDTLAVGHRGKTVILWDVTDPTDPKRQLTLTNPVGGVNSVAFAPDGRTLAAGVVDRVVMLWDITDRTAPIHFPAAKRVDNDTHILLFNPDGPTLAVGGGLDLRTHPTVDVWDYSALINVRADPVTHACAITGRGLTAEEWARHVPQFAYRRSCGD